MGNAYDHSASASAADMLRAAAVRDRYLGPTDASLHRSGFNSMVFVCLMTPAIVLLLVRLSGRITALQSAALRSSPVVPHVPNPAVSPPMS